MDLFDHASMRVGDFPLSRGIPVGGDRSGTRNRQWVRPNFPFAKMEIGDSFDCYPHQCSGAPLIVVQNIVSGAAATHRKNCTGEKPVFTTRQIRGEFVRCWRVS